MIQISFAGLTVFLMLCIMFPGIMQSLIFGYLVTAPIVVGVLVCTK